MDLDPCGGCEPGPSVSARRRLCDRLPRQPPASGGGAGPRLRNKDAGRRLSPGARARVPGSGRRRFGGLPPPPLSGDQARSHRHCGGQRGRRSDGGDPARHQGRGACPARLRRLHLPLGGSRGQGRQHGRQVGGGPDGPAAGPAGLGGALSERRRPQEPDRRADLWRPDGPCAPADPGRLSRDPAG